MHNSFEGNKVKLTSYYITCKWHFAVDLSNRSDWDTCSKQSEYTYLYSRTACEPKIPCSPKLGRGYLESGQFHYSRFFRCLIIEFILS